MNKKFFYSSILTTLTVGVAAGCANSEADGSNGEEDFYAGKTMEMVVPFGSGGGTDVFARYASPRLAEHTEGEPDLQVVNIPGGESITGTNEFMMEEADGTTALTSSASTHTPYLLNHSAVQYELGNMEAIVGFPTGGVTYTTPEHAENIENAADLVYAGISATGLDLVTLLSFDVLGIDVDANLGYEGRGPARVSFEQGESNIDYQTTSAYHSNVEPLVEEGTAEPLYTFGQMEDGELVRDPEFPDIPHLGEYYEELYGEEPSGVEWEAYLDFVNASYTIQKIIWVHEDTPEEAVQALRDGADNMAEDPSFMEEGEEVIGGYEPYTGEDLENSVDAMTNISDDVVDYAIQFLEEEYGVTVE
jgi:hypothetical protein